AFDDRDSRARAGRGPGRAGERRAGGFEGGERPRGRLRRAGRGLVRELRHGP
ncbi:MAG: ATPases with chaperone activity, ATP-binding subunit, partial [uncultured Rubrobacteraceae bacterium]